MNADAATIARPTVEQAIPSRKLVNWTTPRAAELTTTKDLESVRDLLRKRRAAQDPVDHSRTLGQLHLSFGDGTRRAVARFMEEKGLGEPMALTYHALRALGREVLPSHGLDFLLEEIALGEAGRKLADMNFAAFNRMTPGESKPRMIRTSNVRDPLNGQTVRAIRSIHSTDYAPYDNLEFVEDLLTGGYQSYPLVSVTETDQSLRLRFLLGDHDLGEGLALREGHNFIPGGKALPMVEAWNSEVGSRAVTLKPGIFRLICTNTAGSWEDSSTFRWIHRGDRERIRTGVKDAIGELRTSAAGVVKAYDTALGVAIDDAYAWFENATKNEEMTKGEKVAVREAFTDATTTPGGLLASVVDAVTLAAQDAIDEFEQERLEKVGARVLARGLAEALVNGGRLQAA